MIGRTLALYFTRKFIFDVLLVVATLFILIAIVDLVEQLRRASKRPDYELWPVVEVVLYRTPAFAQLTIPFAVLFAAMATLTKLNRTMELVVSRSAGVSAMQFVMPICLAAAALGIAVILIVNPFTIWAEEKSKELVPSAIWGENGPPGDARNNFWIRQVDRTPHGEVGTAIIYAVATRERGKVLDGVRVIRFDAEENVIERITARSAVHLGDQWLFSDAMVNARQGVATKHENYILKTSITPELLLNAAGLPDSITIWELPQTIERIEKSGKNADRYVVRLHELLAMPATLIAMVLIAATVTLRFVRMGFAGQAILGGIATGFVLYVAAEMAYSLGSSGIVPAVLAAWSPSLVAILIGTSILLHQEDG